MQHGDNYLDELRLRAPKSAKQSGIVETNVSSKGRPDLDPMAMVMDTQARGFAAKLRIATKIEADKNKSAK